MFDSNTGQQMKSYFPSLIVAGLAVTGLAGVAFAETPAFMGSWATDASCPSHDIVTYGAKAVESDFMNCEYQSITATGEGSWNVQAGCLYEGAVNTVSIDLKMSGDTLHEEIAGQPAKELVRCDG